jgi:polysaccharide biosynthesis/export protein
VNKGCQVSYLNDRVLIRLLERSKIIQALDLRIVMKIPALLGCLSAIGLIGCTSIPTAGPTTGQVMDQAKKEEQKSFDIVEINSSVVAALSAQPAGSLRARFERYGAPPTPTIGIGDSVSVSIWEAAGGGLFGATPTGESATTTVPSPTTGGAHSVTIPDQVVGTDGGISVPYAGRVHVAGRTPVQVQQAIQQALAERAIEPQVIVTITKSVSDAVTVSGEDVSGARVPLSVGGDRLLDVIAAVGGSKSPLYETFVRLSRDDVTMTIPMDRLVSDPAENIYVWPGDVITVVRAPQTFSVFGATTNNTEIPIDAARMNLAQAIAKAGGLQDMRADPGGVFLFRFEPPPVVKALGAPALVTASAPAGESPILYHLNLRQVDGYFLAERFPIQDNDLIYVANAPLTELQKFFTLLGTITGPVISGVVITRGTGS